MSTLLFGSGKRALACSLTTLKCIIPVMTRERALWEAIATVAIPTLLIWGVLLYVVRGNARSDEWPLYVIFLALPLPLIFPIYKRYLRGPHATKLRTPRYHFLSATATGALGLAYVVFTWLHHRDNSDLVIHVIFGIGWFLIGVRHFQQGVEARRNLRTQ